MSTQYPENRGRTGTGTSGDDIEVRDGSRTGGLRDRVSGEHHDHDHDIDHRHDTTSVRDRDRDRDGVDDRAERRHAAGRTGAVAAGAGAGGYAATEALDPRTVRARQHNRFGGMKLGSAFFGWLTATGLAVLLTALVAGAGTAIGLANGADSGDAQNASADELQTVGIVGGIALLVILFVSYFAGGYVAGRMARFDGAKQGVAVWLWAVLVAVAIAVLGVIAGAKYDVFANVDVFPRLPLNEGDLTTGGVVAAVVLAATALLGAVLGGKAGMLFHRRVDRAGFDPANDPANDPADGPGTASPDYRRV